MLSVDSRTVYSILLFNLNYDSETKIISFLIPIAKDFIISNHENNFNLGYGLYPYNL